MHLHTSRVRNFLFSAVSISLLLTTYPTGAQDSEIGTNLLTEIVSLAKNAYPLGAITTNGYVLSRSISPFNLPLLFPTFGEDSSNFDSELERLDRVIRPAYAPELADSIASVLAQVATDIEFGSRSRTAAEDDAYQYALKILYINVGERTPEYLRFLDYSKQYAIIVDQLASETNPASRLSLQTGLRQLEQDWALFGSRAEIEAALLQEHYLAEPDSDLEVARFRLGVSKYTPPALAAIESALQQSAWLRISGGSSGEIGAITPTLIVDGSEVGQLPILARLSFDATMIEIPRAPLIDPLLLSNKWRLRSGLILSDGDRTTDRPEELLPRIISGVMLIKNVEILFVHDLSTETAGSILRASSATLGGVPLATDQSGSIAIQRRNITIPGPIVVGIITDEIVKIPNPLVGLSWPK